MIYLRLYNKYLNSDAGCNVVINNFETCYKINILLGDSGSGKTLFITNLRSAIDKINGWYIESNVEIIVYPYNTSLNEIQNKKNCLIVIDEGEADKLNKDNHKLAKLLKTSNYFLILDRDKIKTEVNVNAVWKLKEKINDYNNDFRLFDTISGFTLKRVNINRDTTINIDGIITEDATSGKIFWNNIYENKGVLNNKFGCGEIPKEINRIQQIYKGYLLVALDYDVAGKHMIDIYKDTDIDMGKLLFISMESFEEIICNSEFILQAFPEIRDKVINYKDYMDATYKHAGKYFSNLLHSYVKQASPYSKPGDKNYEKFYEKGMKNFKECFLDECCAFKDVYGFSCKLQTVNKRDKLLNNKFETLNQLR